MKDNLRPGAVHIIGGGTLAHVRPHLALCAPAYGTVARDLQSLLANQLVVSQTHLTRMASPTSRLETNEDVAQLLDDLVADPETRVIFMAAAICDFTGETVRDIRYDGAYIETEPSGKDQPRLKTSTSSGPLNHLLVLRPAEKILGRVRKTRKDIFLVGFKTTAGATPDEQYLAGLRLLKTASCNLVLANDVHTRLNMVITPEQARYHETTDRHAALTGLVEMTLLRSQGTFTRSTLIPGDPVPWTDPRVPDNLRKVVDWCVAQGAYKPFLGATVGHFAVKVTDEAQGRRMFLTSRRKTNFNDLYKVGLCAVYAKDDGTHVESMGGPPSVGGQSQRIIFRDYPDTDCILHFHCPKRPSSRVPVRSQRENECGSHQCGKNTSDGLQKFELRNGQHLYAVMLDKHGPNIVFSKDTDPHEVIRFVENNFDLAGRTDEVSASSLRAAPAD